MAYFNDLTELQKLCAIYENSNKIEDYNASYKAYEKHIESGNYTNKELVEYAYLQDRHSENIAKKAISLYKQAIENSKANRESSYYKANNQLIILLSRNNRSYESIDMYKQMVKDEPDNYHSYSFLAQAYFWAKQYDDAWLALEAALKLEPNNAGLLSQAGYVVKALGRYDQTIEFFDKSFALDNENASTLYGKACLYMDIGRYAESIKAWEDVIKWSTEHGFDESYVEWPKNEIERIRKLI